MFEGFLFGFRRNSTNGIILIEMKEIKVSTIALEHGLQLTVEHHVRKVRLVLKDADQELACRKERNSVLKADLQNAKIDRLFKGRLQLQKAGNHLLVLLKAEVMGKIQTSELLNLLDLPTKVE